MRTIVLLGLRGAGKSAVAREVASGLALEAIDLDSLVVKAAGKEIARIFSEEGEPRFRDLERAPLRDVLARPGARVLAPGGGVVLRAENRALLVSSGALLVYLAARPETLAARVESDRATAASRPALVAGGSLLEARAFLEKREPLYRELAHATIETDALDVAAVAKRVVELARKDSS